MLRVVVLDQHGEAAGVDLGVLAEGFLGNQMRAAVQDDLRRLDNADAAVVENIPLGADDLEPPAVKGVAAATQGGQRFQGPRSRCSVEFQSKNARLNGSR